MVARRRLVCAGGLALALLLAPAPLPAPAGLPPPAAANSQPVLRGARGQYVASVLVPVSLGRAWSVVTGYEALAGQLPDIKESRVVRRSGPRLELAQTYQAPYTFGLKIRALLDVVEASPRQISYSLIQGERLRALRGSWTLTPTAGGVLVTHRIQMDAEVPAILRRSHEELFEANLRQTMLAVRRLMTAN